MAGGTHSSCQYLSTTWSGTLGCTVARDGKMHWGVLDTSSFFISGLSFLFLMLVFFISPQGLDL